MLISTEVDIYRFLDNIDHDGRSKHRRQYYTETAEEVKKERLGLSKEKPELTREVFIRNPFSDDRADIVHGLAPSNGRMTGRLGYRERDLTSPSGWKEHTEVLRRGARRNSFRNSSTEG